MSKIHQVLLTIFILNSALSYAQQAEFKFQDKVKRVGKVIEGDTVHLSYSFTNTGDKPLLISHYKVACTCTEVSFPKEPILPGKSSSIEVTFNSTGKIAYQDRSIELYSNAKESPSKIRFTLTVKKE